MHLPHAMMISAYNQILADRTSPMRHVFFVMTSYIIRARGGPEMK